ncbi:MAG TPA: hypothetical protein VF666_19010 [Pyrinomonadaceae bacterium]
MRLFNGLKRFTVVLGIVFALLLSMGATADAKKKGRGWGRGGRFDRHQFGHRNRDNRRHERRELSRHQRDERRSLLRRIRNDRRSGDFHHGEWRDERRELRQHHRQERRTFRNNRRGF